MELGVDRVRPSVSRMELDPDLEEPVVVVAAAERAGAVPGGERGRLVEEEQLGEAAGPEQRAAPPALELEPAGDPALAVVPPADAARLVVQASAIPVDEAARRVGDQLAERRDPVLERHPLDHIHEGLTQKYQRYMNTDGI